ncbi:hypothetical protein [Lacinutrix undariae]
MTFNLKRSFNFLTYSVFLLLFSVQLSAQKKKNANDWYTYTSDEASYSLQLPDAPNYTDDYGTFKVYTYNDSDSKRIYSFFALNLSEIAEGKKPKAIVENFITTMTANLGGEVIDQNTLKYKDGLRYKVLVKLNDQKQLNAIYTYQNDYLYYQSVEDFNNKTEDKNSTRFYNSIQIKDLKPKIEGKWMSYSNAEGAFSLNVPSEPKDLSQEYPNPLDENGAPYLLHLYSVQDLKNDDNYLFRYNDQPVGYYMEDPAAGFESMLESLTAKSELVSEPKTIFLDGYEGREFELLLDSRFHSICRVYFRGNRTYLLLKQKLNLKDKVDPNDEFFNSFKFIDYEDNQLTPLRPKGTNFQVLFFDKTKETIDLEGYDGIYLKNSNDYFALESNSGNVFQFGYSDLQDYFKIKTKKEFYETNMNSLADWNDSIISQKDIKVNDQEALEFYIENQKTKVVTRHQVWVQNKRLFLMTGYLSKESRENEMSNTIFNSFEIIKDEADFDYFSSKTDVLFRDLKSTDTITYNRAFGAFDYYEFDENDLPKLYKALNDTYVSEEKTSAILDMIVSEFLIIEDENTLNVLKTLYNKSATNDSLRASILVTIPVLKDEKALSTYRDLLLASPPLNIDNSWAVTSPYRDSLEYTVANYDDLLKLIKHKDYRNEVLSLASNIFDDKTESVQLITENTNALLQYIDEDLQRYLATRVDDDSYDYSENTLMYSYLRLFNRLKLSHPAVDTFTAALIDNDDDKWMATQALTARVFNNLPIDKKRTDKAFEDLFSRYELIEAYHKTNQFKKVPKKYITPEEFSRLALYNYIGEDEGYPDHLETLGKVTKNKATYYAVTFYYNSEDEDETPTKYFGLVGPTHEFSQEKPFENYSSYSDWDVLEKDWKSQAKKLIPSLIEYGY